MGTRYIILALAISAHAFAQTRTDEILAERESKAARLTPEQPNKWERRLMRLKENDFASPFGVNGLGLKFGGLVPGSGFAFGPNFQAPELAGGRLEFGVSAQASLKSYEKYELRFAAPRLAKGKAFTEFHAVRHNYPSLDYYGPGPHSRKTGRSNYRLEDMAFDFIAGLRPTPRLTFGPSMGYVLNNTGPGDSTRFVSAERIYTPRQAPGIDQKKNFLRLGSFVQYDYRDAPPEARSGGNYFAQFSTFRDFRRLDVEAQQFVPVLNKRRVIALRGHATMLSGQAPFYMQPSLGGSEDLRGYRPFRFRGNNLLVMNAEYRWEVFSGLDMALFADAGKVSDRRSDLNLAHLESDAGIGFRFNARNRTFLRLDVGFSHEGFQVWVKFNNLFKKGPLHTSSSQGDF